MVPSQDASQGTAREGMPVLSVGSRLTSRWATSKLCTTRGGYRVPANMHTATFNFFGVRNLLRGSFAEGRMPGTKSATA